jgi:hypothetical protein
MIKQKRNGYRIILLGLTLAFLHSALMLPLADSAEKDNHQQNLALSQSGPNHTSHSDPISLPGEEKEEENRTEKDSKFFLDILDSSIVYSSSLQVELVSFCFERTQASLTAGIPLYLLKSSFLI